MSSNLVKQIFTVVSPDDKRMIDTSSLMRKRLDEYEASKKPEKKSGFVEGLIAEEVMISEDGEPVEMAVPDVEEMLAKTAEEAERILEEARNEAAGIIAEAQAKAMKTISDANRQAEVEANRLMADAKQRGYEDGYEQAMAQVEAVRMEYAEKEQELDAYYQSKLDEMEPQLVEVITGVYEHILNVELRSYRDSLVYLISSTLRQIEGGKDFIIHVSKEDYAYVSMQKKQFLSGMVSSGCSVEVVEDITLGKNECMIETDNGIFDCGLGTQLAELGENLRILSWTKGE